MTGQIRNKDAVTGTFLVCCFVFETIKELHIGGTLT